MGLRSSLCLAAGCGLFLIGCPSFTNFKTARALDQGEFQFTVAPSVEGFSVPTIDGVGGTQFYPQLELAARYGISDGFDIGIKAWIAGVELDTTISLLRGGFDLALGPGIGFFGIGGSGTSQDGSGSASIYEIPIYIPLIAGINLGYGHQFVFGIEGIPDIVFASASSTNSSGSASASGTSVQVFLGGTVGFSFKIGSSFRIMPEVDVFVPVVTANTNNGSIGSEIGLGGAVIFQGGLGFSFGGDGFNKHSMAPPM